MQKIIARAVVLTVLSVVMIQPIQSLASTVHTELVPGYHKPLIVRGERSLAYENLVKSGILEKSVDEQEVILLANVIYHENWHTDKEHKAAYYTGAVVLNRVKDKDFPDTVYDVLYQKNPIQYSTTHKFFTVEIPEECIKMARNLLRYDYDVPSNVVYQAQFKQGSDVYDIINGDYFCYK